MIHLQPSPLTYVDSPAALSPLPQRRSRRSAFLRLAMCIVGLVALAAAPAAAAVSTWTGAGATNDFSDADNWDAFPGADSDLVFPAGAAFDPLNPPVNDLIGLNINAINIYESYIISGNALTLKIINNNSGGDVMVSLPIATAGDAVLTITVSTAGATLYLPGLMTGNGPVTYSGPGIKRLNGSQDNTLSGLTNVAQGTLILDSNHDAVAGPVMVNVGATLRIIAGGIKDTSPVIVDGIFDLSTATGSDGPATEVIGGLSGNGTVNLGDKVLACTAQAAAYTNFAGDFIGTGGFHQFASGVQVLSGNETSSTGAMSLNGGELHIWGLQPSAPVVVNSGRLVLANDCTIGALTMAGSESVLSFHESISAMNLHGTAASMVMTDESTFQVVALGAPPTLYSYITTGSVNIFGARLSIDTSTYTPAPGAVMTIIENTGSASVFGTFAGHAEGGTVAADNDAEVTFRISYVGGSGNDVTLLRLDAGPQISAIDAGTPSQSGTTVTWTTDVLSDTQIQYGLSSAYGSETALIDTDPMVTSHTQAITGLEPGTLYHFRVLSRNNEGQLAISADQTFATEADIHAPIISNIDSGTPTETSATVTWDTDIEGDSQIIYGLTTSYGSETALDPTLVTEHSQTISGLTAGTVYHYRVLSRGYGGYLATSANQTFTTEADTTPPVMADFACTISGVAINGKLVKIGDVTAVPASNGNFSITVPVPTGPVNMIITFKDNSTEIRTITLDLVPAGEL